MHAFIYVKVLPCCVVCGQEERNERAIGGGGEKRKSELGKWVGNERMNFEGNNGFKLF